jgi:protein ATS1
MLPTGTERVLDVATGANHTLVLLELTENRCEIWGCGDGRKGQLGLNYQKDMLEGLPPTVFRKISLALGDSGLEDYFFKYVSATWETSYVVLSCEGKPDIVLSMGSDDYGDLGIGGSKYPLSDFHIVQFDHLAPTSSRWQVRSISSGQRHVLLQLQSDKASILVGWGTSRHGQLGNPSNSPFSSSPRIVSLQSDAPIENVASSSLGIHHTVILYESGQISGLGSNRKGQLHIVKNPGFGRVISIGCTWNGTYVVVEDGGSHTIYSSGSNSHHQLGRETGGSEPIAIVEFPDSLRSKNTSMEIACGSEHVLALVSCRDSECSQQVWGWGWNEHGNLGVGHTADVPTPVRLWPASYPAEGVSRIYGIWAGLGTSWICADVEDFSST